MDIFDLPIGIGVVATAAKDIGHLITGHLKNLFSELKGTTYAGASASRLVN